MPERREIWVDVVKIIACVLVALGHFFQSMVKAGIVYPSEILQWFNQTIYYFHVPLFLVCSGYLYQKKYRINSVKDWGRKVINKAITLLIPYVFFTIITWILKKFFAANVNEQVGGLFESLFLRPISPYWFLLCLFIIFVITPTVTNFSHFLVLIVVGLFLKSEIVISYFEPFYILSKVAENEIWFLLGMILYRIKSSRPIISNIVFAGSVVLGVFFGGMSILVYMNKIAFLWKSFWLGLFAIISLCVGNMYLFQKERDTRWIEFGARYTMPIFLLHTLFAAAIRIILLKIGITNIMIHFCCGLLGSFWCPIVVADMIRKKNNKFLLYCIGEKQILTKRTMASEV